MRRIASGNAAAKSLPPSDVLRLLALVEDLGERLVPTGLGWQRHEQLDRFLQTTARDGQK